MAVFALFHTLAPGITAADLDLEPTGAPRDDAGSLRIFRFDQRYRGLPLVGGGRVVIVADPEGAIAIRGAIIDSRVDYAHFTAPVEATTATASILRHAHTFSGIPLQSLTASEPALVAVPREASVGWSALVSHGAAHVATVIVAADPNVPAGDLPLLLLDTNQVADLADEAPLTLRSQSLAATLSAGPVVPSTITSLADGTPLVGSTALGRFVLATRRLAAFEAAGKDLKDWLEPLSAEIPVFAAEPGDPRFDTQRAYHFTAELYAFTDRVMRGRWESARPLRHGQKSLFPPGEFFPRGLIFTRSESKCFQNAPACFILAPIMEQPHIVPTAYIHPHPTHPDAPPFEPIGTMVYRNSLTQRVDDRPRIRPLRRRLRRPWAPWEWPRLLWQRRLRARLPRGHHRRGRGVGRDLGQPRRSLVPKEPDRRGQRSRGLRPGL